MCGVAGYLDLRGQRRIDRDVLAKMTDTLVHRGPDSSGLFTEDDLGFGFRRLSIIDPIGGDQPLFSEDRSIVLICNGEIYNYRELTRRLKQRGHSFRTKCDVEVLLHLYEDEGVKLLERLNGQFAFAIYDRKAKELFLARDHFGVSPLYYTTVDGLFLFASEIKAILQHPSVKGEVDLTGLDQVLSFPGLISPRTMFKGISSLRSGYYIRIRNSIVDEAPYWDLDYPRDGDVAYRDRPESYYVEELRSLLDESVRYRLQADVPVGFYLSGGLDSSLIGALISKHSNGSNSHSLSIGFDEKAICESNYQRLMANHIASKHHEITFDWSEISQRLSRMIYHSECPVKETYNTCSMALSEAAKVNGVKVILSGEGADELFAGYVGYRFDRFRTGDSKRADLEAALEEQFRERIWGDRNIFYEKDHSSLNEVKGALYSENLHPEIAQFDCLNFEIVNKERLLGRHWLHQRSYLDFRLRLSDHLVSDHGDRMSLANSVEGRYPFLDVNLVEFSKLVPPDMKLNGYTEKYILKKVAEGFVPQEIIKREKYGFHAPGSPYLLRQRIEWIDDLLSFDRVKRQGYFNPETVERLKTEYLHEGFRLNLPFEDDLLAIVLTFGLFLEVFDLPELT
jgi:asparagine synthase (glutamine-hydrolysing)